MHSTLYVPETSRKPLTPVMQKDTNLQDKKNGELLKYPRYFARKRAALIGGVFGRRRVSSS